MHSGPSGERPALRTYGRRRGRRLSARQQGLLAHELAKFAIDLSAPPAAPAGLFGRDVADVWLEIGFGDGSHLLWQAERNPDIGIIGCEPFIDGVVKVLSVLEGGRLSNVRLHAGDARELLAWLPAGSIGRLFVLFPDPWPKRRHGKRRLLGPATLRVIARAMRPGAELHVATDSGDYARAVLLAAAGEPHLAWLAAGPQDWRGWSWPPTKYQRKALAAGRRCYFLTFRRR
ncbi:MAG TPA: tRNA (guanine(46)-N(7))-methyltransferase TrmB [Hyphomicrobiaceae bacterium]|nr:tRNA (guanine(46)-N(7))-methyltransferase TrmB [Hyphomicrobiaceae bacterium]